MEIWRGPYGWIEEGAVDGTTGLVLAGGDTGDMVAGAGDIDDGGFADMLLYSSYSNTGYLVFGGPANAAALDADGVIDITSASPGVPGYLVDFQSRPGDC